jgi:hypothetical protein
VLTIGGGVVGGGSVLSIAWTGDYLQTLQNDMAMYAIIFAIIGAAQWRELRRAAPRAGWWIVANVLGGVALWLAYAAVAALGPVGAAAVACARCARRSCSRSPPRGVAASSPTRP